MQYKPKSLGDTADISRSHLNSWGIAKILVFGLLVAAGCIVAAVVFSKALAAVIPDSAERMVFAPLGKAVFKEKSEESMNPIMKDKWQRASNIFNQLITNVENKRDIDYRLAFYKGPPNAFAVAGGTIVLTSGLLEMVDSEGGLAFVIAHEIGHQENRHALQRLSFALLNAMVFGSEGASGQMTELSMLANSRDNEKDADLFAVGLVRKTLGSLRGASEFFRDIEEKMGKDSKLKSFFSTHPFTPDRIQYIESITN